MDLLHDFVKMGVAWSGEIPPTPGTKQIVLFASDAMADRHVRIIFEHITARWPTRAAQAALGLHFARAFLGDQLYSDARVSDALSLLTRAGLISRVRGKNRGTYREEVAHTFVNPALIEASRGWGAERAQLRVSGRRGSASLPCPKAIELPLKWNGTTPQANAGAASSQVRYQFLEDSASNF